MLKAPLIFLLVSAAALSAQQGTPSPENKTQVKVNYLNVCTPTQEEQALIKDALTRIPVKPAFAQDFEISRGRATMKETGPSRFVRLRKEFSSDSSFMTAQYSMSTDQKSTIETFVARARDPKEFHEVSIEARVSTDAASPVAVVTSDTPPDRVRIERLGKGSLVLARCEGADQSAYEPLFRQASDIMARYRKALGLRDSFRSDIAWLATASATMTDRKTQPQPAQQSQKK